QPNRRSAAFALRVERPQPFNQPRPSHHLLHLGQKTVPPRLLFLPGVFRLRKAALPLHRSPQPTGRFYPVRAHIPGPFFSVSLKRSRRGEGKTAAATSVSPGPRRSRIAATTARRWPRRSRSDGARSRRFRSEDGL